jgi:hypothetical protein
MLTRVQPIRSIDRIAMAQAHSETYRGFQIQVEAISDDARGLQFRRQITRQLGEHYTVRYERTDFGWHPAGEAEDALLEAIRDAREAVSRLLGGWHEAYSPEAIASRSARVRSVERARKMQKRQDGHGLTVLPL